MNASEAPHKNIRVVFVLARGSIRTNGGFRIIAGYADHLQRRGFDVTLIAPGKAMSGVHLLSHKFKSLFAILKTPSPQENDRPFLESSKVKIVIKDGVQKLKPKDFPEADIYIATWWETAEWVNKLPPTVAKLHLVQDHEIFPYLPLERTRAVHRLPIKKIVVSKWIQAEMVEHYDIRDSVLLENPIDLDQFPFIAREKSASPKIGFLYSKAPRKNCELAIAVIDELTKRFPQIRGVAFGNMAPVAHHPMGQHIDYILKPSQDEIPAIYRSCDVWLFTSESEGFGLPILEAMACGTPVVATPAGAAPQIVSDANGALVESNIEDVANAVEKIINLSTDEWRTMSHCAVETARKYDWPSAVGKFETVIHKAIADIQKS